MHMWGDGFDFDRLNRAGKQIEDIYRENTGLQLHWKEKYGTLRFEWISDPKLAKDDPDWLRFVDRFDEQFLFAVHITVCDYPDLAKEILSDFRFHNNWDNINKHRPTTSDAASEEAEDV